MKRARRPIAIVIDASVAKACGKQAEGSSTGISVACADALQAIKDAGLHAAMSEPLDDEWLRHASTFARKWLVQMFSRKRVRRVESIPLHDGLRRALPALPDEGIQRAIEKDLHLIELALVTDRRVLSLDERMRLHLGNLTLRVSALSRVHWANPGDATCLVWLQAGAPDAPALLLVRVS
jgi:hypothetical protein